MRGLKQNPGEYKLAKVWSHALRVRGLKLCLQRENCRVCWRSHALRVRGLKLFDLIVKAQNTMSHALRVRGLKPISDFQLYPLSAVARSTRAWIETRQGIRFGFFCVSHALRVRGLKPAGSRQR